MPQLTQQARSEREGKETQAHALPSKLLPLTAIRGLGFVTSFALEGQPRPAPGCEQARISPVVLRTQLLRGLRPLPHPPSPPIKTSCHCFPENTLSWNHSLTALQKIFVCITSPHTSSLKTKCQISSPTCSSTPCAPASPHRHRLHSQLSSTLHLSGERHSFRAPCEESSDLFPPHIASRLPHRI